MLHKKLIIFIVIIILVTLGFTGFLMINERNKDYINISKEKEEQIEAIIDDCKKLHPDLQSSNVFVTWAVQDLEQKQLMDNILGSLTILGEYKNKRLHIIIEHFIIVIIVISQYTFILKRPRMHRKILLSLR